MTIQRWTGIAISGLSIYTVLANLAHPQADHPEHTLLGILCGGFGAIIFSLSIVFEHTVMKIAQVISIAIVAIITICIPGNTTFQIVFGVILFFISLALTWSFDLFDKKPLVIIPICIIILLFLMSYVQGSFVTGAATAMGISVIAAILWAIISSKVRRLQKIAKEAVHRGDVMAEALQERISDAKIQR